MGVSKTLDLVSRHYWWPGVRKHVYKFVQFCESCQRVKASRQKAGGLLRPLSTPDRRWAVISMDFVVQLPLTDHGRNVVLVFVDELTKMAHFVPTIGSCDSAEAANLFLTHVFRLHGLPIQGLSLCLTFGRHSSTCVASSKLRPQHSILKLMARRNESMGYLKITSVTLSMNTKMIGMDS